MSLLEGKRRARVSPSMLENVSLSPTSSLSSPKVRCVVVAGNEQKRLCHGEMKCLLDFSLPFYYLRSVVP